MAEKIKAARLRADKFTNAEHRRLTWAAEPEAGTSPEALTDPAYWAHVAHLLRPALGDKRRPIHKIEAYVEDGSWYAELLVRRIGAGEIFVKLLRVERLDETAEAETPAGIYEVKWRGPNAKWSVVRKADGTVIKDGLADKDEAALWMAGHLQAAA